MLGLESFQTVSIFFQYESEVVEVSLIDNNIDYESVSIFF